jgi:DNA-binding NarL/FixJ family response regulator
VLIAEMSFIAKVDLAFLIGHDNSSASIKLLAIVDEHDPALCKKLLRMGGSGAVPRSAPASVYRRALRALADGELWAPRATQAALVRELLLDNHPKGLTERQKEILALIAEGYQNQRIADSLFVSRETVRWHIRCIYKKLGVRNRDQAITHMGGSRDLAPAKPVQGAVPVANALKAANAQG